MWGFSDNFFNSLKFYIAIQPPFNMPSIAFYRTANHLQLLFLSSKNNEPDLLKHDSPPLLTYTY